MSVQLSSPVFFRSFHDYNRPERDLQKMNPQITKDVFKAHFLPCFSLRDAASMSSVTKGWDRSVQEFFKQRVAKLSPKPSLGFSRVLEGPDLAHIERATCPLPQSLEAKEFIQKYGIPDLETGIEKLVKIIGKLDRNAKLKFEIQMPLDPGTRFKGIVCFTNEEITVDSFAAQFDAIQREITLVLENKLSSVQSLEELFEDVQKTRENLHKIQSSPEAEKKKKAEEIIERVRIYPVTSGKGHFGMRALVPPLKARCLIAERMSQFVQRLQQDGPLPLVALLEDLRGKIRGEDYAFLQGLLHEEVVTKDLNLDPLVKMEGELNKAVQKRSTELEAEDLGNVVPAPVVNPIPQPVMNAVPQPVVNPVPQPVVNTVPLNNGAEESLTLMSPAISSMPRDLLISFVVCFASEMVMYELARTLYSLEGNVSLEHFAGRAALNLALSYLFNWLILSKDGDYPKIPLSLLPGIAVSVAGIALAVFQSSPVFKRS